MSRIIAIITVAVAILISPAIQASTVTIDFEEFSLGAGNGVYPTTLQSKGFDFSGRVTFNDSTEVILGSSSGTNAYGGGIDGLGQDGFGVLALVDIERSDGGAFGIYSLDLVLDADPNGFTSISGVLAGGGAASLGVPVGTGDWLNLQSVRFRAEGNQFGFGGASVEVDNVVVTPIPAAVWLFGSGLGLLGWMRRRQTA